MTWSGSMAPSSIISCIISHSTLKSSANKGRISAAFPVLCCEYDTPPTALLRRSERHPEVTTTAFPYRHAIGSSILLHNSDRLYTTSNVGTSTHPARSATSERTNSLNENLIGIYIVIDISPPAGRGCYTKLQLARD